MKGRITSLLLVIAFAFSFSSCEKEETVTPGDVKGLITSKTWTFVSITHDNPANALGVSLLETFLENASYKFNDDGTYSATLLGLPGSGIWSLSEDEKTFTIDDDEYTIITITSTSCIYEDKDGYKYSWN